MVWYSLKLGSFSFKYTPLSFTPEDYPDVDKDGNPVARVYKQKAIYTYQNDKGQEVADRFKLINGEVAGKLSKTKEVEEWKEADLSEARDLKAEHIYLLENNAELRQRLSTEDKAIKFAFSNGNGYRAYVAYILPYGKDLVMVCGNLYVSQEIERISAGEQQAKKAKEMLQQDVSGVKRAKIGSLVKI